MAKTALITGVTGQDGSYLAEVLLEKGYDVHGIIRRTSQFNRGFIEGTLAKAKAEGKVFELHYGNMGDSSSLHRIISITRPDEIYNLAAQSHVRVSFDEPEYAADIDGVGVLRLMEGIRKQLDKKFGHLGVRVVEDNIRVITRGFDEVERLNIDDFVDEGFSTWYFDQA